MGSYFKIISVPFGYIMKLCYAIVPNYGVALILFATLTKILMLPFTIKQQKNTIKREIDQQKLKPKLDQLRAKCGNNKELYNRESMKLQQEEGINPMGSFGSGCLLPLIQMIIVLGVIGVVSGPLSHILGLSSDLLTNAMGILKDLKGTQISRYPELSLIEAIESNPGLFSSLGEDVVASISKFNTTLMGINFANVPKMGWNLTIFVPIMTLLVQFASIIQMNKNNINVNTDPSQAKTMKVMHCLPMTLFSFVYFLMPVGIAFYWMFSTILTMIQSAILNRTMNIREAVDSYFEEEQNNRKREREEKTRIQKQIADGAKVLPEEMEKVTSKKEINKQKINEARKRMADKYGETNDEG
jgi:YidC/Oxa1 family membrane protein insertase